MGKHEYFPEDRHNFLHPLSEYVARHKELKVYDVDLIEIMSEELNHIQSLFGIDTHLTMASW